MGNDETGAENGEANKARADIANAEREKEHTLCQTTKIKNIIRQNFIEELLL